VKSWFSLEIRLRLVASRNKPLVQWKLVEKGQATPPDALAIGHETDGQLLYAARAWFNGGVHLGKYVHYMLPSG
jgi:hypothetical protein